jgi:hypothetical protein
MPDSTPGNSILLDGQDSIQHSVPHAVGLDQRLGSQVANITLPTASATTQNGNPAWTDTPADASGSVSSEHIRIQFLPGYFDDRKPRGRDSTQKCRYCNTAFTRGFNLRRHLDTCKFRQVPPQQKATMHSVIPCPVKSCKYHCRKDNMILHLWSGKHKFCGSCSIRRAAVCPRYCCEHCYFDFDTNEELKAHFELCPERARRAERARNVKTRRLGHA